MRASPKAKPRNPDDGRIPALDGLRAVAIALVMLSHGFILSDVSTQRARAIGYIAGHLGGLGVALFFAISGYLITTLLLRELKAAGRISPEGILHSPRLPHSAACVRVPGHFARRGRRAPSRRDRQRVALLQQLLEARTWFTQHFWSLSMEEHFYLLWPITLVIFGVRGAAKAACTIIAVTMVWRPWSLAHVHLPYPALQRTDMRLDAFLFAGLLAIALHSECLREYRPRLRGVLSSTRFRWCTALLLAAVSVLAVIGSIPATSTLLQSAILPVFMASLMFATGSPIFRALESAPLRWMGRISYGLYLWQQFFLVAHTAPTFAVAARLFFPRLAAVFAVAAISYYAMERYAQTFSRRLSARAEPSARLQSSSPRGERNGALLASLQQEKRDAGSLGRGSVNRPMKTG